ncbi:unnamed protein product [Ascophyllum nodosum]
MKRSSSLLLQVVLVLLYPCLNKSYLLFGVVRPATNNALSHNLRFMSGWSGSSSISRNRERPTFRRRQDHRPWCCPEWMAMTQQNYRSVRLPFPYPLRRGFLWRCSMVSSVEGASPVPPPSTTVPEASKLEAFEAFVQKWCDRGTSAFPLWVLGAAAVGLWRPAALEWFGADLITAALATTMVCMGMTLRVDDFKGVLRRPRPVLAGVLAQYTVMPMLGYLTAKLFKLPPALAAGVTLVGCCPGGTASNLVTLIARGDVALSVAMTSVSTLMAAVVTGPLTKLLVGALVDISAATLVKATAQVVFLPIVTGLLLSTYARGITCRLSPYTPLLCVVLVAMICGSVVAANAAVLLGSGAALVGAVLTLHGSGFALGYGGMRALGFTEREARTASIEVGMQNSALAVVLAQRGLPDPLSAIPGAVSATCHSLIGSALAAFWRTRDSEADDARGGGASDLRPR